ncbi:H-NS family nucleoid-associated regulatory protein [Caballeronia sp. M1242]|uniref:H-NS family nucleoid-associated regulatory protein n=1 Tax=Caballeronia sp. M1242 TaxID=2814653 RepID=UPI0019D1D4CA|nr:H-NS family nucleoid-associated regulatory protein [Caballeronia sp. M1242]QSN64597.1 H-NS histone family protein [Caballeronia sp. M1242]
MATLKDIQTKIAKLQAQAEAIAKKESAGVIARIHSLMDEYGLTVDDLRADAAGKNTSTKRGASTGSQKGGASNAKYRDPKTGATWSGHGRAPGWIANAKNRNRFLIDAGASTASSADAKSAKPLGNYVRGKQPAKYRDPRSGAEWSGRGKAPAWLASAKDRTKFLIDATAANGASERKTATKKAATKKAATKKTATKKAAKKASAKRASVSEAAQNGSANAAEAS